MKLDPHQDFLLALIKAKPDMMIEAMRARLFADLGVTASPGAIRTFLDRHGLTFKKTSAHASERDRPDVLDQRDDWFESQPDLDPTELVFIDETWARTNMERRYGRAPRGERLRAGIAHGHWNRTIIIAGLRLTGMTTPLTIDGSINGASFPDYVTNVLAPTLSAGESVVMDNLSRHKSDKVREAIEAVGARRLFLPPYSPEFNPMENAFAKLKAHLRRAAERTVDALRKAIDRLVHLVTPQDCSKMAGHGPKKPLDHHGYSKNKRSTRGKPYGPEARPQR